METRRGGCLPLPGWHEGAGVEVEEVEWVVSLCWNLVCTLRFAGISTKLREAVIENSLKFDGILWSKQEVANEAFLFVQNDMLLKIYGVQMQTGRGTMPQVQAQ